MTSAVETLLRHALKPLTPWLSDPATEDVAVNAPGGTVWAFQRGKWKQHLAPSLDYNTIKAIGLLAGALNKQTVGPESPILDTDLPGGERLNLCMEPAVPTGMLCLTIRRPGSTLFESVSDRYDTGNWNEWQRFRTGRDLTALLDLYKAGEFYEFVRAAVLARLNILMTGATGSGKTTFANYLMTAINPGDRVVTVEDAIELDVPQPNNVRFKCGQDWTDRGTVTPQQLVKAGLRMRPDRLIVQEVRDEEVAWLLVKQVGTAHPGSILTSIHGHDAASAIMRLAVLCKGSQTGRGTEMKDLIKMLSAIIDVIVPLQSPFTKDDPKRSIGRVWFVGDADRRGKTLMELFEE